MKMCLANGVALVILAIFSVWLGWRFQVDLEPTWPVACLVMGIVAGVCGCLAMDCFGHVLDACEEQDDA